MSGYFDLDLEENLTMYANMSNHTNSTIPNDDESNHESLIVIIVLLAIFGLVLLMFIECFPNSIPGCNGPLTTILIKIKKCLIEEFSCPQENPVSYSYSDSEDEYEDYVYPSKSVVEIDKFKNHGDVIIFIGNSSCEGDSGDPLECSICAESFKSYHDKHDKNDENYSNNHSIENINNEESIVIGFDEENNPNEEVNTDIDEINKIEEINDKDSNKIVRLVCNHFYHLKCIMEWDKKGNGCPLCRRPIEVAQHYII